MTPQLWAQSSPHTEGSMGSWCKNSNLKVNTSKIKEMVVYFWKEKSPVIPLQINGLTIKIVDSFKFLDTVISSGLDWEMNTNFILKKAQQRCTSSGS